MARRKQQAAEANQGVATDHTPSSPSRPPVTCLYVYRGEKRCIVSWATFEGAAAFLEYLVQDIEDPSAFRWIKHSVTRRTGLVWDGYGLRVEAGTEAELETLIETETDWMLPEPYRGMINQLWSDKVPEPDAHSSEARAERKAARANKEPREKKVPRSASRPEGWLHVSEVIDCEPSHARAALRKLGWDKPDFGWWFDPKRKDEVAKAIKGALK